MLQHWAIQTWLIGAKANKYDLTCQIIGTWLPSVSWSLEEYKDWRWAQDGYPY